MRLASHSLALLAASEARMLPVDGVSHVDQETNPARLAHISDGGMGSVKKSSRSRQHLIAAVLSILPFSAPLQDAASAWTLPVAARSRNSQRFPSRHVLGPRLTMEEQGATLSTSDSAWRDNEDWALLDGAPAFTVDNGEQVATFWRALAASTAALSERSAKDIEGRWAELAQKVPEKASQRVGAQPLVLDDWTNLPEGRMSGRIKGSFVTITVSLEGRLTTGRAGGVEPTYVSAVGGRIYELGKPSDASAGGLALASPVAAASPASTQLAEQPLWGRPGSERRNVFQTSLIAVLTGGLGAVAGYELKPTPPPKSSPQVTRIVIQNGDSRPKSAPVGEKPPERPAVQLTVKEQRERAALRVEKDKKKIALMQERLAEDEQRLKTYERVEEQRGGDTPAVRLTD